MTTATIPNAGRKAGEHFRTGAGGRAGEGTDSGENANDAFPARPVSLAERARVAAEEIAATIAADLAERREHEMRQAREEIASELTRCLGVVADPRDISIEEFSPDRFRGVAVVDGLTFTTQHDYGRSYRAERLAIRVPCARSCGGRVDVRVESLADLHRILTEPQRHGHECLVKYDQDGEPITDREGNPLSPPAPPTTSTRALPNASQFIARIRVAADALGEAMAEEMKIADASKSLLADITETKRRGSLSPALDAAWIANREAQRQAMRTRLLAEADLDCAKLIAKLEVGRELRSKE